MYNYFSFVIPNSLDATEAAIVIGSPTTVTSPFNTDPTTIEETVKF